MSQDFPNTVLMWESTRDEGSRFEEIFEPEVKVLLSWRDVEAAVEVGAVVPSEAYALWAYWAAPNSPARMAAQALAQPSPESTGQPQLGTAPAPTSARVAAVAINSMGNSADTEPPLEMKAPRQRNQRQGLPAVVRTLLAVVLAGLLVWIAGKGMGMWSR
jgi:hypothetical protein